jgi:hypothetical protein
MTGTSDSSYCHRPDDPCSRSARIIELRPVTSVGFDHERFAVDFSRSVRAHGDTKIRK